MMRDGVPPDAQQEWDEAEAERLRQEQERSKPPSGERTAPKPKVVPMAPELPWFKGSDLTWPPENDQYVSRHLAITSDRITLLSGPPGCGKGFLALGIALSALPGGEPIGELGAFEAQGPVGWLDYEEGRRALGRRFLRAFYGLQPHEPDRTQMHFLDATATPAWKLNAGAFAHHLAAEIKRLGLKLLVVDSLHACAAVEDPNSASAAAPLQTLDALGKASGCAVLVLAHTRKQLKDGAAEATLDDVRGTSAYAGVAGSIWNGRRKGGKGGVLWTHTKCSSHGESDSFVLQWTDEPNGTLLLDAKLELPEQEGGGKDAARSLASAELQQRLIALVQEHPGITQDALIEIAGVKWERAKGQLSVLQLNGVMHIRAGKRGAKHYHPGTDSSNDLLPNDASQ